MPSDKHNLRTARTRDLTSSLVLSRDVPFHQPQLLQCLHHGTTFDPPYFSSQLHKVTICGRNVMASVWDIKIAEALLVFCLAYYVMKWLKWRCYGFQVLGAHFTSIFSVFSVMAGWIAEMLFMLFFTYNGQNIAEYKLYWFMDFLIINLWGARFTSTFSVFSVMVGWMAGILFMLFFAYTAV